MEINCHIPDLVQAKGNCKIYILYTGAEGMLQQRNEKFT